MNYIGLYILFIWSSIEVKILHAAVEWQQMTVWHFLIFSWKNIYYQFKLICSGNFHKICRYIFSEVIPMSTYNICFHAEIWKYQYFMVEKNELSYLELCSKRNIKCSFLWEIRKNITHFMICHLLILPSAKQRLSHVYFLFGNYSFSNSCLDLSETINKNWRFLLAVFCLIMITWDNVNVALPSEIVLLFPSDLSDVIKMISCSFNDLFTSWKKYNYLK